MCAKKKKPSVSFHRVERTFCFPFRQHVFFFLFSLLYFFSEKKRKLKFFGYLHEAWNCLVEADILFLLSNQTNKKQTNRSFFAFFCSPRHCYFWFYRTKKKWNKKKNENCLNLMGDKSQNQGFMLFKKNLHPSNLALKKKQNKKKRPSYRRWYSLPRYITHLALRG